MRHDNRVRRESATSLDRDLLRLLADRGAACRETWVDPEEMAGRLDRPPAEIGSALRAMAAEGYLRVTRIERGAILTITDRGRGELDGPTGEDRIELAGTIEDGLGKGGEFVALPGYERQFEARLGYRPFPGTLNVALTEDAARSRRELADVPGIPIDEWEADGTTYGAATCYPASIRADEGSARELVHVLVPERTAHDVDKLELIAPMRLRADPAYDTGSEVTIHV
ncbi:DUF120 domain-containing protein [Halorarum halobium]|uniref:DUF120 domain-containing protein n=1 Tax=Halorarum halobium TaxID=3075121 RepID=UPI0028AB9178|nr:DUF120 domain-containing protein [Halobaculum sp. XH14]